MNLTDDEPSEREERQREHLQRLAEFDHWESLTHKEREDRIKWALQNS